MMSELKVYAFWGGINSKCLVGEEGVTVMAAVQRMQAYVRVWV